LALWLVLAGLLSPSPPVSAAVGPTEGIADRIDLASPAGRSLAAGGAAEVVRYTWPCGDRAYPLAGIELGMANGPLVLRFRVPRPDQPLTLELREFRRTNDGRVAYLVEADGRPIQFRNRRFEGPGPSSAFVDIPVQAVAQGTLTVRITNRCDNPVCFSAAILYDGLEGYARREGLVQPMYVGPIIDRVLGDQAALTRIREVLPDTAEVKPMVSLCSLAVAHWTPEIVAEKLDRVIAVARDLDMKAEIQAITWWGGTPAGCDGQGGRWHDVAYQQVTYVPSTDQFGLSVPNCWSNTPWLTVGSERLNTFKAECFARFGRMLRERYDRAPADFPLFSIVLDNEPTYWAGGNPGVPADQLADFNPVMVEAARAQGVTLDPRDGLGPDERAFLRRGLLDYNREMNRGLRRGLGDGPLAERVFTHTFMATVNGLFEDYLQATASGVLRDGRLGGEWNADVALLPVLEQHRELGVPAGINRECGGGLSVLFDVPFAYAMGCDHLTLFNIADERLEEIAPALRAGWPEVKAHAWHHNLLSTNHFRDGDAALEAAFAERHGVVAEPWTGGGFGVRGEGNGASGTALMELSSQRLTGRPAFESLVLRYDARAFVWDFGKGGPVPNPGAYLALRAGTRRDALAEVDRMADSVKRAGDSIDLSALARGAATVWVEFEFHPIGLPGWVMLFDVELEQPWDEEDLLYTNRSYRADRLRCESAVVGWRADAAWALARAREDAAAWPADDADRPRLAAAQELYDAGSYRQAYQAVRALVEARSPRPEAGAWAPPPDRQERGELAAADTAHIRFDPYDAGYCGAAVRLAPGATIRIEENGVVRADQTAVDLRPGDDVTLEVRGHLATAVLARRGSASGSVSACTAMAPFAMPVVAVEGQPERPLSYLAKITAGSPFKGWQVGYQPVAVGDLVDSRWNPVTGRIVALERK